MSNALEARFHALRDSIIQAMSELGPDTAYPAISRCNGTWKRLALDVERAATQAGEARQWLKETLFCTAPWKNFQKLRTARWKATDEYKAAHKKRSRDYYERVTKPRRQAEAKARKLAALQEGRQA